MPAGRLPLWWWLLCAGSEGVEGGASTLGSEGGEGTTASSSHHSHLGVPARLQLDEPATSCYQVLIADVHQEPEIAE